jgi:Family of unknown function (DUF5317)
MLLLVPLVVAAGCAPLLGGDLRRLSIVRFRHVWLLLAALATQVWLIARPGPQTPFLTTLELGAYPLAFAFLYVNRRIPGALPIAAGAASNFIAIAANGGVMPAARSAVIIAGLPLDYHGIYANSEAIAHPRLLWLGDIFPIPSAVPLATVFSVGDVLIAFGAAYAVLRITLGAWSRAGDRRDGGRSGDDEPTETPAAEAGTRSPAGP